MTFIWSFSLAQDILLVALVGEQLSVFPQFNASAIQDRTTRIRDQKQQREGYSFGKKLMGGFINIFCGFRAQV